MSRPANDAQLIIVFLGLAFLLIILGGLLITGSDEVKQTVIQTCKEER